MYYVDITSPKPMTLDLIQQTAKCSQSEACEIQEVIEQVLPLSPEGRSVLNKSLPEQIKFAKMVIA